MSVRLHINVDHVATVRNARGTRYPDPVLAAQLCEAAGADGITAHLREDRRHIVDSDIERLRACLSTVLNLEMAATDEMIGLAERVRPDVITLVPEKREERTTEGGLDLIGQRRAVEAALAMAHRAGIKASLFVEADIETVKTAHALGAHQVELHTGEYCNATSAGHTPLRAARELRRLHEATQAARTLGLQVAAGHGLTRHNVGPVVAIHGISEVNIGHAVVSDAVLFGLDRSVRDFRSAIDRGVALRSQ